VGKGCSICAALILSLKQAEEATRPTTGAAQGAIYAVLACPGRIPPPLMSARAARDAFKMDKELKRCPAADARRTWCRSITGKWKRWAGSGTAW